MQAETAPYITPQDYLRYEREAETRNEYHDGQVYAMTGASENHNLIVVNLVRCLGNQLAGRTCKMYANDMRVKSQSGAHYFYPDVVALCGTSEFEDTAKDTLLNPAVVIEVLSPSTEAYDRGDKFDAYREINSLLDYLLVAQDHASIHHLARAVDNTWLFASHQGLDAVVALPSIGCSLPLAEIFAMVEFPDLPRHKGVIRRVKEESPGY